MVPPHSRWILLYSIVLTMEWRVWSYEVWDCGAPSLPRDTAVFLVSTAEWTGPGVPHTLLIQLFSLVLKAEWRVWSYEV